MAETTNKTTAPSKSSVKVCANNTQISQPSGKKPKTLNWQEQRKLKRENRQEEEDRNTLASLESAIPQSNIGFKLLKQMGYTPGSTLGKEGSGLAEPVGLEIRRTRAGIGREDSRKEKRKREEERMEWERGKEEALMEDFGCRHKEQWRSRRIVVNYHKAKAALEQLENKEVVAEADKDEEDAENEEEEEEIITEEDLQDILIKLREEYRYCLFCGCQHSYPTAWEQMKMTIERLFLITRICSTTQLPEEDATLPKLGMDRFVLDGRLLFQVGDF
ncbi:G patch domain-containing protein 11-like isoform X1 [Camellia sinensis]|uniref:G patch domain-containing protein 11-like isoform X1 n=1 Tax=Camellia sinensis TaxID=4442 RepID=UPI001035A451|nr:G patch domain-containing protein 11-like isoform X1 [Camellia sinensis]